MKAWELLSISRRGIDRRKPVSLQQLLIPHETIERMGIAIESSSIC